MFAWNHDPASNLIPNLPKPIFVSQLSCVGIASPSQLKNGSSHTTRHIPYFVHANGSHATQHLHTLSLPNVPSTKAVAPSVSRITAPVSPAPQIVCGWADCSLGCIISDCPSKSKAVMPYSTSPVQVDRMTGVFPRGSQWVIWQTSNAIGLQCCMQHQPLVRMPKALEQNQATPEKISSKEQTSNKINDRRRGNQSSWFIIFLVTIGGHGVDGTWSRNGRMMRGDWNWKICAWCCPRHYGGIVGHRSM